MPRSDADIARELDVQGRLTTLDVRVSQLREDMTRIERNAAETEKFSRDTQTELRVLTRRFDDLQKTLDDASGRRWALVPVLLSVILGAFITAIGTLMMWWLNLFPPR